MQIYEIQNYVPINSEVRVFLTAKCIEKGLHKENRGNKDYLEGTLRVIKAETISINYGRDRIIVNIEDIVKCVILSYPTDYGKKLITKEDLKNMKTYMEEFDEYGNNSFLVVDQIRQELLYILELLSSIALNEAASKVRQFIEALVQGNEQTLNSVYLFEDATGSLPGEWVNRIIALQYLYYNNNLQKGEFYEAVDYLKSNLVFKEDGIDWFLLAVTYRKQDIKPKAALLYAIKKYQQYSAVGFVGENLKIVISLCILYGDYGTIIRIMDSEVGNENITLLAKGIVSMLLNDIYDRKYEAWTIYTELECMHLDKLRDDIYLAASRIKDYGDDDILYRIDYVYQFILQYLKNNPENITSSGSSNNAKLGYLFEYRTNSDTGYVLSLDLLPYFFHKNSLRNTRIISEFVDNFNEHRLKDFCVTFRKLRNTKKLQAGEIDAVLIGSVNI